MSDSQDPNDLIPLEMPNLENPGISHSPLDLGGSVEINGPEPTQKMPSVEKQASSATQNTAPQLIAAERITGVRTFFTKLHAGAIIFLDEQITEWLAKNPDIRIKRTNAVTGEIQGKKTEPNIIVNVWY